MSELVSAGDSHGRGRAPAAPRVRPRGRVEGRTPGRRRHRGGALPGLARLRRGRRRGTTTAVRAGGTAASWCGRHSGATLRAGRHISAYMPYFGERGAAPARPIGRHGRARHRALRDGRADGVPGVARRPHRPGQPRPVHRAAPGGAEPRRAPSRRPGRDVHRPRPLQARQRPGRPLRRRPRPQPDGRPAHRHDARGRRGGPLRWRRIRRLRRGRPRGGCAGHGRAHPHTG